MSNTSHRGPSDVCEEFINSLLTPTEKVIIDRISVTIKEGNSFESF